jgi:hypothetical protein
MADFSIAVKQAQLTEGPIYERATFGLLNIEARGEMLARALRIESAVEHYQTGPYISGYHLAEWLCWNWWRWRWEPKPSVDTRPPLSWDLAHRMSDIGSGYLWPNITIACDGLQCELTSEPSHPLDTPLFSYLGTRTVTVSAEALESAVNLFIETVIQWLGDSRVSGTNLQVMWSELLQERSEPESTRFRKVEALLGRDPDVVDAKDVENWLSDVDSLGENALLELATGPDATLLSAQQIVDISQSDGFEIKPDDGIKIPELLIGGQGDTPSLLGNVAAWRIGVMAANAVRKAASIGDELISDTLLAEMVGTSRHAIRSSKCTNSVSWVFNQDGRRAHLALRSSRDTRRRFDIARLLGDRLFSDQMYTSDEPLVPATLSYSYRQKAQRAFAAELLSPWETVLVMLRNDQSEENIDRVSNHFKVSARTIENLIRNNGGVSRNQAGNDILC